MKKLVCFIICLMFSLITLTACNSTYENSFISHNYERDYSQAIVTLTPITESGKRADGTEWTYTTDETKIYKSQLVNYINNYAATYVNYYGMEYNEVIDYFVEQLILTELVITEADVRFEMHDIFWTQEDIDTIQHSVYSTIDSYLDEICNEILEKSGRETLTSSENADNTTDTTYPVKPEETEKVERVFDPATCTYGSGQKHDDWYLNGTWFTEKAENFYSLPGNYGNEETKSLAREGVKRLVSLLADNTDNILSLTDEEKATIESEVETLKKTINEKGVAYAYRDLGKTLMVKKLYGDSLIMSQKMTILQNFIESGVTVTEEEIVAKYNKMLAEQTSNYSSNESSYDSAATGSDLVLYHANSNYVYVKHILIPFSDAQKTYLTNYKKNHTNEQYLAERQRQVNNIKAYAHVNGEDDLSRELTVDQIWSEIRTKMAGVSANAYDAERLFDDLTYKYNTDPGAFGNETGYAVKYKLNDGESESYMQEFADAARSFRNEGYKVGQVYDEYILTDYGVHIMYYANDFEAGSTLGLNDYTTPGRYTLVKDQIRDDLLKSATSAAYTKWQNERIYYYRNTKDIVNLIEKAYKDLYTDHDHNHDHD
ncbi:MAG: hypothetical protein J1F36_04410 [Clostridiales bacterium]|nr:hypothetical protein [Clostridiales bacterium]